jgi:hypothetical protein
MIPVTIAGVEMVGMLILTIYALADNERIYASIFAAILAALLSALLGYQFLFGLIQSEFYTGATPATDQPLGYFFIMVSIMIGVITLAIVTDSLLKRKERREAQ